MIILRIALTFILVNLTVLVFGSEKFISIDCKPEYQFFKKAKVNIRIKNITGTPIIPYKIIVKSGILIGEKSFIRKINGFYYNKNKMIALKNHVVKTYDSKKKKYNRYSVYQGPDIISLIKILYPENSINILLDIMPDYNYTNKLTVEFFYIPASSIKAEFYEFYSSDKVELSHKENVKIDYYSLINKIRSPKKNLVTLEKYILKVKPVKVSDDEPIKIQYPEVSLDEALDKAGINEYDKVIYLSANDFWVIESNHITFFVGKDINYSIYIEIIDILTEKIKKLEHDLTFYAYSKDSELDETLITRLAKEKYGIQYYGHSSEEVEVTVPIKKIVDFLQIITGLNYKISNYDSGVLRIEKF